MTDAVGVAFRDGLENRLGPVGLPGVDRLAQEVAVGELVGLGVVGGRVARFFASEIEADNGQAMFIAELDGAAGHFHGCQGAQLFARCPGEQMEQATEVGAHVLIDGAHGAGDDAELERKIVAVHHGGRSVVRLSAALQSVGDGTYHIFHLQLVTDMELWRKPYLDVAHAFGNVVFSQLAGDSLNALGIAQHRTGVGEPAQILAEIGVAILEDQLAEAVFFMGGEFDFMGLGQLDERTEPKGPIEMDVEIALGYGADKFPCNGRFHGRQCSTSRQVAQDARS